MGEGAEDREGRVTFFRVSLAFDVRFGIYIDTPKALAQFIRRRARNPCREIKGITRAVADRYSFLLVRVPSRAVAFGCPMV